MKMMIAVGAASLLLLTGCGSADDSLDTSPRMGETVSTDGIAVTLSKSSESCWDLTVRNDRFSRPIEPSEGGIVRGYAGVQGSAVPLGIEEPEPFASDYNWGSLGEIPAGESRQVRLCRADWDLRADRVHVDINRQTVEFS